MIEPAHDLAISKQAKALNISRGSVYYLPRPLLARGCCEACWLPRGARSGVVM
jgi:hypothetical protein